jgi:hypothetical protein
VHSVQITTEDGRTSRQLIEDAEDARAVAVQAKTDPRVTRVTIASRLQSRWIVEEVIG